MIKNYLLALVCVIPLLSSLQSISASSVRTSKYRRGIENKKNVRAKPNHLGSNLGTDFRFNNLSVYGRYQGAFQGVATVEDEKNITRLIDYRRDYKDRLSISGSDL